MLEVLTIHNFALIRDINLHLPSGFIVLTGETGAGKSLLVSALTFLAGGAVSPGVVRFGENEALV
ncbi:MAG: AAA family ATPase, partial [bacterium]